MNICNGPASAGADICKQTSPYFSTKLRMRFPLFVSTLLCLSAQPFYCQHSPFIFSTALCLSAQLFFLSAHPLFVRKTEDDVPFVCQHSQASSVTLVCYKHVDVNYASMWAKVHDTAKHTDKPLMQMFSRVSK